MVACSCLFTVTSLSDSVLGKFIVFSSAGALYLPSCSKEEGTLPVPVETQSALLLQVVCSRAHASDVPICAEQKGTTKFFMKCCGRPMTTSS